MNLIEYLNNNYEAYGPWKKVSEDGKACVVEGSQGVQVECVLLDDVAETADNVIRQYKRNTMQMVADRMPGAIRDLLSGKLGFDKS